MLYVFFIAIGLFVIVLLAGLCYFAQDSVKRNPNRNLVKHWINIASPTGKSFYFLYNEEQNWGSKEYLAKKIIKLLKDGIKIQNFDQSISEIPWEGLKEFQHPYRDIKCLKIIPENLEIENGKSVDFSIQATDINGNIRTIAVEPVFWSTTGGMINKSKPFQVTYKTTKAGSFKVNALLGNISTATEIKVKDPSQLVSLIILPESLILELGQSQLLKLQGKDQHGQTIDVTNVAWSKEVIVSRRCETVPIEKSEINGSSLLFKGHIPGEYVLTAKSGSIEAKATVVVKEPARLAILNISPSRVSLVTGELQHFTVEGKDQYGRWISTKTVSWRASSGLIDNCGDFIAEVAGEVVITVEIEGIKATVYVTVTEPSRLASISIEPLWAEMQVGQTQRFTATGQDQYSKPIDTGLLEWSATIGQIDSNGTFRATAPGKCIITAKSGNVYSQVSAIVTAKILSFPATLIDSAIKDPITQDPFRAGETVYCCIACKLGHHEDSWEYYGRQCSRCNSDQNVDVYRLPDTLIAKASQYSSNTQIDLSSLQGQDSDGNSYTLRDAITRSTHNERSRSEENLWRFEYSEPQHLESRGVIARRVLAVRETEIQVEDCHGDVVWLPIALLLAVAIVPVAAKGAIIGGVVIWAIANRLPRRVPPGEIINKGYIFAKNIHQLRSKRNTQVTVVGEIKLILSLPDRPPHLYFNRDTREGFYAYIHRGCIKNFPDPETLLGKTVLLSGKIIVYGNQRPHIILRRSSQLQEIRKNLLVYG